MTKISYGYRTIKIRLGNIKSLISLRVSVRIYKTIIIGKIFIYFFF